MPARCSLACSMLAALAACSAGGGGGGGGRMDAGPGGPPTGPEDTMDRCFNGFDDDGDGSIDCNDPGCAAFPDCGGGPGFDAGPGGGPPFDECATDSFQAMNGVAPIDVIWVIDNSGSMRGEADQVQRNMERFAMAFAPLALDFRIVVMSSAGFVSVPPPLGTDPERFLYVAQDTQSNHALVNLDTYFSSYSGFLRPHATTHFVAVTDDESELMSASAFRAAMEAKLGHAFTFHSIASPPGSMHCIPSPSFCLMNGEGCVGPEDDAAANGDEYWALSMMTGGRTFSICTADWSGLFSTLSAAVAVPMPLPCVFAVPDPMDGTEVDRMKVNILFTPSTGGDPDPIPNVGDFSRCGDAGGWYYDPEDPDRIVVCPSTCSRLESDASGRVDVAIGCETLII